MSIDQISRRHFLRGAGALAGGTMLRLSIPAAMAAAQAACSARDEGVAFATLGATEAAQFEAIAARILPTTDTPGAREAGVIHFFDNVLGDQMADMLAPLRAGLAEFQTGIAARFGGIAAFADLSAADQDAWLGEQDQTPFFGMVRMLTLCGFFAMSEYGGNKDQVGWKLINFAGHGAATYPFGYYDAEYAGVEFVNTTALEGAAHGH
ncbi:MAG TPA: gluconate 2-dehydrogenase subunit 3 family protein [Pseudomonadales bacterium]|nr:gluconate 2-dehydrogenase subunit 3 family protein [Pseudomonadales bacterium]